MAPLNMSTLLYEPMKRYRFIKFGLISSLLLTSCLSAPGLAQLPDLQGRSITPSVPAAQRQPESHIPENYILGAGDTIRIDVFRVPEYGGEYEVLINGALNLPVVGQVRVSGLTIEQSITEISRAFGQRLRRPIVNVYLVSPRPLRIGIAGEVAHPGEYILQREGTQFPSLAGALEGGWWHYAIG